MDGVTLFAAGLIGGGIAILAVAVVAAARRIGLLRDRRAVAARRGRGYAPVRPRDARLRPDLDGARPPAVFREDPMTRRGAPSPDRRDPRTRDVPRPLGAEPRRTARRDDAGSDRPRRPDGNRGRQGSPPVRPSALVGDTVQLQSVPAWSIPARPLNDGPRSPGRPQPDDVFNDAPQYVDSIEPGANASRRHEINRPEGHVYGGR
jgi:hypothetical protein